jgi:hypothetical protein
VTRTQRAVLGVVVVAVAACAQRGGGKVTREVVPIRVLDPGSQGSGSGSAADAVSFLSGPGGFPMPRDAATIEDAPPDHTFKVPRRQPEVITELKVNLAQQGFKIDDEYVEDLLHTHWYITRAGVAYKVTVAGDTQEHTLIIVTID